LSVYILLEIVLLVKNFYPNIWSKNEILVKHFNLKNKILARKIANFVENLLIKTRNFSQKLFFKNGILDKNQSFDQNFLSKIEPLVKNRNFDQTSKFLRKFIQKIDKFMKTTV